MIDKARVDQTIARIQLHGDLSAGDLTVIQQLQNEHAELRAIAENLAASDILETYRGMYVTGCPVCDGEPVGFPYPQTVEHTADCPYARAVALVGPASERTEAGE